MATLAPRQEIYRASCLGTEIRIRINPDSAWIVVQRPGAEQYYRDLLPDEVSSVLSDFHAIGKSPQRFEAFVNGLTA